MSWNYDQLADSVYEFAKQPENTQKAIQEKVEQFCTYETYLDMVTMRARALRNTENGQNLLAEATQKFPVTLSSEEVTVTLDDLKSYGIVITAGGEGERLKVSLMEQGFTAEQLADFTKATWPLPDFYEGFGALQINLALLSRLSQKIGFDIPVIVTTGPANTDTARVIPEIIAKANSFGLKNIQIIAQDERLHLTDESQIAWIEKNGEITLATNPDETGGPLMKLLEENSDGVSPLSWIESLGASRIMVLQGTAVYNPLLIEQIASAGKQFDGMGIGISRAAFPSTDPYGTFVTVASEDGDQLKIIEKNVRNSETESLTDQNGKFLPFNTGFYAFTTELLKNNPLPDYASPVKIIFPGYDNAEKVGYAATDVIAPAEKAGVLTIPETDFAVIKTAADLPVLTEAAKKFNLVQFCK